MADQPRPKALLWFTLYCVMNILFYMCLPCVGVLGIWLHSDPLKSSGVHIGPMGPLLLIGGIVLIPLGLVLTGAFILPFVVPPKPWVWKYDLSLIGLGVPSPLFFISIPLAAMWAKPDVRAWFQLPPLEGPPAAGPQPSAPPAATPPAQPPPNQP